MELTAVAARFVLATVFVLAGTAKLAARQAFARGVERYEVLPPRLLRPVALAIPPFEVATGILLAAGAATRVAALLVGAALAGFTIAVVTALARGKRLDCGCFGPAAPRPITWWTVARNLALLAMAVLVVAEAPTALAVDAVFGRRGTVSDAEASAVLAAASAAVLAILLSGESLRYRRLSATAGGVRP